MDKFFLGLFLVVVGYFAWGGAKATLAEHGIIGVRSPINGSVQSPIVSERESLLK